MPPRAAPTPDAVSVRAVVRCEDDPVIDDARRLIDQHLFTDVASEPWVQYVEFDPELDRWYVRFGCEGRDAATIYFDLRDRTLRYELYFMPAPANDPAPLHAWLLRRNRDIYGARFAIDDAGDVYLDGRVALEHLTVEELDRIIGVLYECTELWFGYAVQLGFGPS
jgi:hypothetical protein